MTFLSLFGPVRVFINLGRPLAIIERKTVQPIQVFQITVVGFAWSLTGRPMGVAFLVRPIVH